MKTTIVEVGSPALLIDTEDEDDIIAALLYKANHIKAKTEPEVFRHAASFLMQAQQNDAARSFGAENSHWVFSRNRNLQINATCPSCNTVLVAADEYMPLRGYNYCPNCGADMRERPLPSAKNAATFPGGEGLGGSNNGTTQT